MLERLHLQNFKCFDELTLPIAPLTLLTGFNAAGKSTSLQPALLLAQSLRSGHLGSGIALNGDLVKLGTPGEVLNELSDRNRRLSIGAGSGAVDAWWRLSAEDRNSGSSLFIEQVEFTGGNAGAFSTAGWPVMAGLVSEYAELLDAIRNIVYLSAVRAGAADAFPSWDVTDPIRADVGVQGEYAPWWFQRHLDDDVDLERRHPDETAPTLRRQLNAWAGELFPGADANTQRIQRTSLVRLELRTRTTEDYRRPANIGYGLTYAFPVLVALLLARKGQTIVIDSPEAHLHPRGQSAMGRLLALFAAAGVQIVVETHSDHVLNGVRRAVARRAIAPEQVLVHFFTPRGQGPNPEAQVTMLTYNSAGSPDHWPDGFADQAEVDLASLAGWS